MASCLTCIFAREVIPGRNSCLSHFGTMRHQPAGPALASGRRGRVFESRRLDYLVKEPEMPYSAFPVLFVLTMADLLYALDGFPYMVIRSSLISKY